MERKSFIRSLLTLAAAPKLIAELNIPMVPSPLPAGGITTLFNELKMVIPEWFPAMMAKYGNDDFLDLMNLLGTKAATSSDFQMVEFSNNELKVRDTEPGEIGKQVTITLTNNYNQS